MFPPKNILFPVDCSKRCIAVGKMVGAFTRRFQAKLTLLLVIERPTMGYDFPFEKVMPAKEVLEAFLVDELKDLDVKRILLDGDPADEIVKYAHQTGFDLIMLPTHGYGPFRSLLLGSVTAKVLHDVKCPVWTAAHTEHPRLTDRVDCRSVLCAVDLAPESVDLIHYAADLAHAFQAKLRLVHAVTTIECNPEEYLDTDFRQFLFQANREEIMKLQRQAETDLELCLESGDVAPAVRKMALHHHADLVVIGRGKLQETLGRLRTNAYAIIRDSPCPVLSL